MQSSEVCLHALATQMQWYCRALCAKELAQGPYTVGLLSVLQDERSN